MNKCYQIVINKTEYKYYDIDTGYHIIQLLLNQLSILTHQMHDNHVIIDIANQIAEVNDNITRMVPEDHYITIKATVVPNPGLEIARLFKEGGIL